ncbi:MICOS complex subunit MIC26-like isoform X2 [Sinocyclocheilus rhinocerous]|uniref:MICOS complex subunit MIC26-like isoform X2 n=1 Tax=Sinocyclocheilus rhinocerous TaxID=307959 RepID=UPI0007BA6D32|nr:PREDICTED: MICOS complex subunit MIC26-like isoform X2 [Sinocyclocheilus rhinocerous]
MSYLGKIAKVAVPGALGLVSATVFAASEAKENTTLMTDELSLYDTPGSQLRYEEPEVGHVEQAAASLRKTVEPYISWCQTQFAMEKVQSYYKTVEPGVNTTQSIVKDMYAFLNDPPSEFFPSVGVIGFSGFLGLYLAKGSRIKRLMFPIGLMVLSTSMFYPQHAASVARTTKHYIFSWGSEGRVVLEELLRGKSSSKDKVEKTQKTDSQKSS